MAAILCAVVATGTSRASAQTGHNADVEPLVTKVARQCATDSNQAASQPPNFELGDLIVVDVDRLRTWVNAGGNPRGLVLFLDSMPLPAVTPIAVKDNGNGSYTLTFPLLHTVQNQQTWTTLLTSCSDQLPVSVGMPNQAPFNADPSLQIHLVRASAGWMTLAIGAFLVVGVVFVWAAIRFPLLRDSDTGQTGNNRPWSLARCQMALWFLTVLGAWLALLAITKHANIIPDAVLALLGISAGTAVSSAIVDNSKRVAKMTQLENLQAELAKTNAALAALGPPNPSAPAQQGELQGKVNQLTSQIASLKTDLAGTPSQSWLQDILSDSGGFSFYRFQIFAWTLVFWIYFVVSVWRYLAMPEFSGQLLGLLGISSGTYLGFKFPETK